MALNFLTSAVVMLEGIFFIGLVQQMVFGPKRCEVLFLGHECFASGQSLRTFVHPLSVIDVICIA